MIDSNHWLINMSVQEILFNCTCPGQIQAVNISCLSFYLIKLLFQMTEYEEFFFHLTVLELRRSKLLERNHTLDPYRDLTTYFT